ncbi:MAG: hypothetical protein E7531_03740 [Ruminococcaceae bacterium]|nr:hypothetical protein [Oscillospiraceae bacterium]
MKTPLFKSTDATTAIYQHETNVETKTDSIPEQLKQYKELLDSGVLTEEEFELKKKELLGL